MPRPNCWIHTPLGLKYDPFDPQRRPTWAYDIAHLLAQKPRFNGAGHEQVSVAEHSLMVAATLPPDLRGWGLLHDASEAYLFDIPTPYKNHPTMAPLVALDREIQAAIYAHFAMDGPPPPRLKRADLAILRVEAEAVIAGSIDGWEAWQSGYDLSDLTPSAMPWREARDAWLEQFAIRFPGVPTRPSEVMA